MLSSWCVRSSAQSLSRRTFSALQNQTSSADYMHQEQLVSKKESKDFIGQAYQSGILKTSSNDLVSNRFFSGNYNNPNSKDSLLKWIAYAAMFSGGALMLTLKQKVQVAHCTEPTFAVDFNKSSEDISEKWKDCKITIYQYQTCPFCSKARSFLLANSIPFSIEEVHPINKKEIKFSKYKKVPIVVVEQNGVEVQVNDSSVIVSALSSYMIDNSGKTLKDVLDEYPTTTVIEADGKTERKVIENRHNLVLPEGKLNENQLESLSNESKWRAWADNHLVHLISPNVYRTLRESYDAFHYHVSLGKFHGTREGTVAEYGGALAMWVISKRLRKRHCKNEDVRVDLYEAINEWTEAVGDQKFIGGESPNLADVSVFGVISVMENLVVWDDLMLHTNLEPWYNRTKKHVEANGNLLNGYHVSPKPQQEETTTQAVAA